MACLVFKHEFLATLKARPTDDSSAAVVVGASETGLVGGNPSSQSHSIELAQGDIFMEQKMRFGLVFCRWHY